jgi:hypothetical protein
VTRHLSSYETASYTPQSRGMLPALHLHTACCAVSQVKSTKNTFTPPYSNSSFAVYFILYTTMPVEPTINLTILFSETSNSCPNKLGLYLINNYTNVQGDYKCCERLHIFIIDKKVIATLKSNAHHYACV